MSAEQLPSFGSPTGYRNYAIRLVGQAKIADQELSGALEALRDGHGSRQAVAEAQKNRDDAYAAIKAMQGSVTGFKAWRWRLQGFDIQKFWASQALDMPGAPTTATSGPVADALASAAEADRQGQTQAAAQAFRQAADLCNTQSDALAVAKRAFAAGYSAGTRYALTRASDLSTNETEGLAVARVADNQGFLGVASGAYRHAADLARTKDECLEVAKDAGARGYTTGARYALDRAQKVVDGSIK